MGVDVSGVGVGAVWPPLQPVACDSQLVRGGGRGYSVDLELFDAEFGEVAGLLSGRFCRCEPARGALDLVAG
jgi:hypothetical protein